ncbi:P-loop containing nucleoside triphosphate hydrolase [Glarea lozoyensis ATCC 20868]|uniref:p-loop containing nucleoside triphosphate hydrolase n=1 Tax=Glarea lozoyensis (strain ATCC 20868 / MF5171) TaxID=1116229 RepID=S3CYM3_GLAL2|nr:P-loop containing nucleoside triphosphate hydrolase [Glarea lozoyensis ATCC 20868]EPE31362.1 P-loop containing nucleoside triphosphate hydrolase [Glarea lozoyensis ATCC 20868]
MDYESIHGEGHSNFPSTHRLPTISLAQALEESKGSGRFISTGVRGLDGGLVNRGDEVDGDGREEGKGEGEYGKGTGKGIGGVERGKVMEIYGPPGVGKTGVGMQIAASALGSGDGVMWVDASHPIPGIRFMHILDSHLQKTKSSQEESSSEIRTAEDALENLTHYSVPTLAHLLALFSQQTANHPAPNTSLIVIDSFSTLISTAFPRTAEPPAVANKKPGAPKPTNPSSRKFPILQHLLGTLQKLAATRNIAIVILSQCVTKMRPGIGAVLVPAINVPSWDQGLSSRVVLFRDWGWNDEGGDAVYGARLAQVVKAEGLTLPEGRGWLAGFTITETGIRSLPLPTFAVFNPPTVPPFNPRHFQDGQPHSTPQVLPQKRKLAFTDLEIPDSEGEDDEDYGWAEEDEVEVPVMPPQWQGSEDILIPDPKEKEIEAEEEEENDVEEPDEMNPNDALQDGKTGTGEILDSDDELAL